MARTCDQWYPEDIDPTLWTHINYAFALIDTSSFAIAQMNSYDIEYYSRVIALKARNPSLRVFISVGGWGAGGAVFSSMVSNSGNRAVFIESAMLLLQTYGFDGIDVDWEYPAAPDRDGTPADTENFVEFLKELRAACGTSYGISATLPSSYWYLQGFDVVGMEPYVDWFNFMSYDIHGTWDGDSPFTQAVVAPHTNLTEAAEGLDLLWRNNINPSKVVLGLAFYGRSFTLATPSCNTPQCPFSGGGNPGSCTATSGILSDAEIQSIISANSLTPTLDTNAAVKWITWGGNQWVSYDDSETFQLKRTFADNLCLGGTMTWALDLDNPTTAEAQSNLALGPLRAIDGDQVDQNPAYARAKLAAAVVSNNIQLITFWTRCSQFAPICGVGFKTLTWGRGNIFDADGLSASACQYAGGFRRALCIESNVEIGDCQWFGTPSACLQGCPPGYEQVARNSQPEGRINCQPGHFASYCCRGLYVLQSNAQVCPTTYNSIQLSGGLSSRSANGLLILRDSPYALTPESGLGDIGTTEECGYQAGGVIIGGPGGFISNIGAVQALPGGALPNILTGDWVQDPNYSGRYVFQLVNNAPYPTSISTGTQVSCTATSTVTSTTYTYHSTITKSCDGSKYPQACQHYSSVMRAVPGLGTQQSCTYPLLPASIPRPEVSAWNAQHAKDWISWIPYFRGTQICQRDEYPPALFLQGSRGAWIRYLPQSQNAGAGQLWRKLCDTAPPSSSNINAGETASGVCYSSMTLTISLKVMDMQFTNMPNQADDGIDVNPCYPMLIASDPGFALLTDDVWYGAQPHLQFSHYTTLYSASPPATLTVGKGSPPRTSRSGVPFKRDLALQEAVFTDPDNIVVDTGNSSRRPDMAELWQHFGLLRCGDQDCAKEKEVLNVPGLYIPPPPKPETITSEAYSSPTFTARSAPTSGRSITGAVQTTAFDSKGSPAPKPTMWRA
ncbi:hypothetical protein MMC18_007723 [Xylographa bjoerkii]|nr:hypothetical protein [Xylographa bjoerkii]